MTGIWYLACLGTLFLGQTGCVYCDLKFLDRYEGDSVVLPCVIEQRTPSPFGVYLKRTSWPNNDMLFKLTNEEFVAGTDDDKHRLSISGDPSRHTLNVTISQLRANDTDHYYCEFVVENPTSADVRLRSKTEFFLHVCADPLRSVDIEFIETCAGSSVVLPCLPPHGGSMAVEGVSLKRQKGRAPVEVLLHPKHQPGHSHPSSSPKVQLASVPGPGGITYSLTLQQLQPEDSALYSCQLLLWGWPDSSNTLGRRVFFVSVQEVQCGCSSYSTLLYALSSAVAVQLFLLLVLGFVICKGKSRRQVKSHTQAPIYEEMSRVQTASQKLGPCHLNELESSEYRNCPVKKSCPENHYESPRSGLCPRSESHE